MARPQPSVAIDAMKRQCSRSRRRRRRKSSARCSKRMAVGAPFPPDIKKETKLSANGVAAEWVNCAGRPRERTEWCFSPAWRRLRHRFDQNPSRPDGTDFRVRPKSARAWFWIIALAPENPLPPAAVDDSVSGLSMADRPKGIKPYRRYAVAGDSAGGGLGRGDAGGDSRGRAFRCRRAGVCLSPWVDLEGIGESMKTLSAKADPVVQRDGLVGMAAGLPAKGKDPRSPLAAPLYADLKGLSTTPDPGR